MPTVLLKDIVSNFSTTVFLCIYSLRVGSIGLPCVLLKGHQKSYSVWENVFAGCITNLFREIK